MNIEKLTYTNERGESVSFSRASPYHTNFKDVTGLSDVHNSISRTNSTGQDGDTFIGSRIKSRDIEIVGNIRERDRAKARVLRRALTRVMNPQYSGTLVYECDGFKRVIGCRVDDSPGYIRQTIFEQFTIRILCLNPFWREEKEAREDIALWTGGFEFSEPDGLELTDDWEIGCRQPSLIVNVFNGGDVKAGIRVDFRALGIVKNPLLLNVNTREYIKLNVTMEAGDVITVSTGYGEKRAVLHRNGLASDAFRYIDIDSTYLQLSVGDNLLRYDSDTNLENLEVSIYHNNYYLGV